MLESKVESYLVQRIHSYGGMCLKMTGYKGMPDRLVLEPGKHAIFVELKRPGMKPRPSQKHYQEKLRNLGYVVLNIDSCQGVDALWPVLEE